jgi:hypothetical protein
MIFSSSFEWNNIQLVIVEEYFCLFHFLRGQKYHFTITDYILSSSNELDIILILSTIMSYLLFSKMLYKQNVLDKYIFLNCTK